MKTLLIDISGIILFVILAFALYNIAVAFYIYYMSDEWFKKNKEEDTTFWMRTNKEGPEIVCRNVQPTLPVKKIVKKHKKEKK